MKERPVTAVLGAGTMGAGIAQVLASAGYPVHLWDIGEQPLARGVDGILKRLNRQVEKGRLSQEEADGTFARVRTTSRLEELASADWVIEAVVERLQVKRELFTRLEAVTGEEAVLATNTSSLSVTSIASALRRPERMLGLHFFNPAPAMPLVEVVKGMRTAPEAVEGALRFVRSLGKHPVRVKDTPGFLVNRVARPFHLEAYRMVGDGVAEKEQLDRILRSAGFKMGPFELQDLIGIDINYAASVSVYEGFFHEPRHRPHPEQRMMMESGSLGRKVGRGHYTYDG
ncbi:3-hydroxyacyl-CoA dehydrogenase NAD-binding domain-containing protein [Kroppenstedtia eburnea]|uniref:3-hydroxyacyl-CoA dehydrogenase NAD-binding domain-containing protein n=1 Tax=Kroppenstedtia eburnea TaxID=714067 RepID=UPI00363A0823